MALFLDFLLTGVKKDLSPFLNFRFLGMVVDQVLKMTDRLPKLNGMHQFDAGFVRVNCAIEMLRSNSFR